MDQRLSLEKYAMNIRMCDFMMTLGIEEEFITVSESNYFYSPSAPKILTKLILKNFNYIYKSSLETPFGRTGVSIGNTGFSNGFSIVETKTSPHKCIDSLKDELVFHRGNLADIASKNGLALLPIGLHPLFSPDICGIENCAALHIHLGGTRKESYLNILRNIPKLIALSANSPFYSGKQYAMSSRAMFSPSIGIPQNYYERKSDLIFNKFLNTTELRVCDTQILPTDAVAAAAVVACISEIASSDKISRSEYQIERDKSILHGKNEINIADLYNKIEDISIDLSLNDYVKFFFKRITGAEWQIDCANRLGIPTLLSSLWDSMKKGRLNIKISSQFINNDVRDVQNLLFLLPYSPILLANIAKKIRQDDAVNTTELFGRNPKNNFKDSLYLS